MVYEDVIKWFIERLEGVEHVGEKVAPKADQEPYLLVLKGAISINREGETCPIESPARESKANGAIDRSIRTWQGQMRALKSCFEARVGKRLAA